MKTVKKVQIEVIKDINEVTSEVTTSTATVSYDSIMNLKDSKKIPFNNSLYVVIKQIGTTLLCNKIAIED